MIDITDLTTAINSFKAIVAEAAVTPTSLGNLLQSIVNSLGGALSESDKDALEEAIGTAAEAAGTAEQAVTTLLGKLGVASFKCFLFSTA